MAKNHRGTLHISRTGPPSAIWRGRTTPSGEENNLMVRASESDSEAAPEATAVNA
jgi:hypothetical protein